MIDYKYKDLFYKSNVSKQLNIETSDGTIDNSDIYLDTFSLEESICNDNELMFGGCIASTLKFQIKNDGIARDQKVLKVTEIIESDTQNPLKIGTYKVHSDKCSSDRSYREIIAYDDMYHVNNTDVSDWFNGLIFPMSLKKLRDSLFEYINIEQVEVELPNDSAIIYSSAESGSTISASDVVQDICGINGCFGKINRDGLFDYLFLSTSNPYELPSGNRIDLAYEDYYTTQINKLKIVQSNLDYNYNYGTGTNCYVMNANVLSFGRTVEELEVIAGKLYDIISQITYIPVDMNIKGNPCLEAGDYIKLYAKDGTEILTYILNRTLTGIQSAKDNYVADGVKIYYQNLNSTERTIANINGKVTEVSNNITYEHTFINSEDISIDSEETTIIQINANAMTETSVIFLCTIPFTISLDGYLEFNYYLNGSIITTDVVNFYSARGNNVVTLSNVFNIAENERVILRVTARTKYFESDYRKQEAKIISFENYINTGTYEETAINTDIPSASISARAIKAVMFARGLALGTEWDGNIEVMDSIKLIDIYNTRLIPFNSEFVFADKTPDVSEFINSFDLIPINNTGMLAFYDNILFDEIIKNYIINTDKSSLYTYDDNYVTSIESYKLQTNYSYISNLETIDFGKLEAVELDLTKFSSIISLGVSI